MSDLISRADAIAVIRKNHYRLYGHGMTEDVLVADLGAIPSADARIASTEEKTAVWVTTDGVTSTE